MSKLTYEELILLDNLIYLKWNAKEDEKLINIVYELINDGEFDYLMDTVGDCIIRMTRNEWMNILEQIKNRPNLNNLRIKNVNIYNEAMKFACFIDDENNATVVFRGTSTIREWEDNGQGSYEHESKEQLDALNYINSLDYNNIIVTGHSKGGNKAQFVTILSPKITKCISINGQGFSKEFISKYEKEINKNSWKIVSINAKYDYVNCLFNSIAEQNFYIKTEIQINPFDYHKANILLDEHGNLRPVTNESEFSKTINYFSSNVISGLPMDIRFLVIDGVIDIIELILCRGENTNNLLKAAGEYLIMFCYENCFKYKEIFNISYAVAEILILPLIFWSEFVYIEENNSKELLNVITKNIRILGDGIIKKLQIIDKDQIQLIETTSKAISELTYTLEKEILKL